MKGEEQKGVGWGCRRPASKGACQSALAWVDLMVEGIGMI